MDQNKELYGFPTSVNLKYFASNFQEKQREAKQKEKELVNAAIEKEVLKIKESPWKLFSGNRNVAANTEIKNIEEEFIDNYYLDLLKMEYLLTTKGIRSHNFKLLRLLFHPHSPIENNSKTSLASDKPGVLNNCIRLIETGIYGVKDRIRNIAERCISFVHRAIYLSYCFTLCSHVQRLVVPLKDTSSLREVIKSGSRNIYVFEKHSPYDLMFVILSLFWNDLPIPVVFFNGNSKSWRFSFLEKIMLTLIDWKNLPFEDDVSNNEKLKIQLERVFKKNRDVVYCTGDNHEEEFRTLGQVVENIMGTSDLPDVVFTTINFSFESLSENVIENVLLSNQKTPSDDSFLPYNFNHKLGIVRAKFGTPVSVKEVISSYGGNVNQKISTRLEWELSKSKILMSTDLVSFILLYKFRDGVKLSDLIKEVDLFKNELNHRGKLIGFSGNARSVVNHAITMLGGKIATVQAHNGCIIKPVLQLPDVLGLSRSSQNALNYFVLDAALMTCFGVLFKSDLEDIFRCRDSLVFNNAQLIEMIEQLCEILQFEFNFDNPSVPLSSEIANVIFKYIEEEYFVKDEKLMTDEERWGHRLAKHLESDDEDDYDYRSNRGDTYTVHFDNNGDLYSKIIFYKKSLQPVLESYLVIIGELKSLINKQILHSELMKQIFLKLKNSFENDQLKYPESVSLKFVSSCIRLMEKWNVLISYTIDEIKVCSLTTEYNNERTLCDVERKVRSFL